MSESKKTTWSMKFKDGWANLLTGFGIAGRDKTKSTTIRRSVQMTEEEQFSLYGTDGFGKTVIDIPVEDMTKKGFKVVGDTDGLIVKYYKKKKFKKDVIEILRWSKVYGAGIGVMIINDGTENEEEPLSLPLNEENIQEIEDIKVYQKWEVDATSGIDQDVDSKTYGELLAYVITPANTSKTITVHKSRCLVIDGEPLTNKERLQNHNWGYSFYQATQEMIKRLSVVYALIESVVDDFVTNTLTMTNLQEMIATGKESVVQTRIHLLDQTKHLINTRLLDENEKFEKVSSSVAGLSDIVYADQSGLSAVSRIPMTRLFGQTTKGLSNSANTDVDNWHDHVSAMQEDILLPIDERLLYLIQISKNGPTKGIVNEEWSIEYLPLKQMSEKEQAETRKITADTDNIYIQSQVLHPDEVASSRFAGDTYSADTTLMFDRKVTGFEEPDGDDKNNSGDGE